MKLYISACIAAQAMAASNDHWAVLVAGTKHYSNSYKNQSDIAMANEILKEHSVPDTQIIYMAYDSVAQSDDNPVKGDIFNWPDGPNCYNAPQLDYKGQEANADNFLSVLKGEKDRASGPVLETNENSIIFIFYSGDGKEDGAQKMPDGSFIWPTSLMDAIFYMRDKKMYKHIVIYWASDYAEQVFDTLPGNYNVFGIASSGRDEVQQNAYCPPDDVH